MAEITAGQFIIATIIFGAIIAGAFSLISMAIPDTDNARFKEYNATFNKFNTIKSNAEETANQIEDGKPISGVLGILNGLIESSWGSLKLIWNSVSTMNTIISETASGGMGIPIPTWLTGMIITIILVTIAFAMMAAWFKWRI